MSSMDSFLIFIHTFHEDDFQHGLVTNSLFARFPLKFLNQTFRQKDGGRPAFVSQAHSAMAPPDIMTQILFFKFSKLSVFWQFFHKFLPPVFSLSGRIWALSGHPGS